MRPAGFSSAAPESEKKKAFFSIGEPRILGYRKSNYATLGPVPEAPELVDQDLAMIGAKLPKEITLSPLEYAATQECLKGAQAVGSFLDHALFASVQEGREIDNLDFSSPEASASSLITLRARRADQERVLLSAARALGHSMPLTAKASANLMLAYRASILASTSRAIVPAEVVHALHRSQLVSPKIFGGLIAQAKMESDRLNSLTPAAVLKKAKPRKKKVSKPASHQASSSQQPMSDTATVTKKKRKGKDKGKKGKKTGGGASRSSKSGGSGASSRP